MAYQYFRIDRETGEEERVTRETLVERTAMRYNDAEQTVSDAETKANIWFEAIIAGGFADYKVVSD